MGLVSLPTWRGGNATADYFTIFIRAEEKGGCESRPKPSVYAVLGLLFDVFFLSEDGDQDRIER